MNEYDEIIAVNEANEVVILHTPRKSVIVL
jgi:hypothetical protein